jgi:type I site-specific restriction endonuclease
VPRAASGPKSPASSCLPWRAGQAQSHISDIDRTAEEHEGFGLFLRAITGLSREAAVQAFSDFQRGRTLSPAEYAFVDLLIESLTQNGYLDVGELYEPPFKRVGTLTSCFATLQTSM